MGPAFILTLTLAGGEVEWDAPAGCPDAAAVAEQVQAYLGEADPTFTARARVRAVDGRFEAIVHVVGESGSNERTLTAADCETLADTTALIIAVDADVLAVAPARDVQEVPAPPVGASDLHPGGMAGLIRPRSDPPPADRGRGAGDNRADSPSSVGSPPGVVTDSPALPRRSAPGLGLRVDVGLGVGALPGANLALGLNVTMRWQRWSLELGGVHHFVRPARLPPPNEAAGADVRTWAGNLRVRWVPSVPQVEFPIGGGVELGDMIADGVDVENSRQRHGLWGAGLLGVGLAVVPHPRIALWLDPAFVLAFARPGFAVDAPGSSSLLAHRPAIPGFRASLGFEVRFAGREEKQ